MAKYSYSLDVGKDLDDETQEKAYEDKIKAMLEDDEKPKKQKKKMVKKKKGKEPTVQVKNPGMEVEAPQPVEKAVTPDEDAGFFKWLFVLVIVLVLAFVVYKYAVVPSASALSCTTDFIVNQGGVELRYDSATAAQQFWLRKALTSGDEDISRDILRMVSCDEDINKSSNPVEFADCDVDLTYVVVDDATVTKVLGLDDLDKIPLLQRATIAARMHNREEFDNFVLAYDWDGEATWRVIFN